MPEVSPVIDSFHPVDCHRRHLFSSYGLSIYSESVLHQVPLMFQLKKTGLNAYQSN
jgi:hypothetical protein